VLKGADNCEDCGADLRDLYQGEPANPLERTLCDALSALNPPKPVIASPGDTIRSVVDGMIARRHGAVCVLDGDLVVGIFTERDIVNRVAGRGFDLAMTPISDVMTRDPICLSTENTVAQAMNQMSVGGLRHLPILKEGHLVGITTIRGLLAYVVGKAML
jgi:CBS domain-containing protein